MKILKIRVNNINCLRCKWEIDFEKEPLKSAGLFAITGPTGSGKSTLLDAITLALFNRIPRFESKLSKDNIDKAGFILTRNEKDCYVEVEYSCKSGKYCSKWNISKTRNNTFREYEMELVNLGSNHIIESKKALVPSKNEELIGLNYDQFIKSILLSQGGFAKFLESSKSDRSKLLEDITGMEIYSRLGKKAYEVYKEKTDAIAIQKQTLKNEQRQLLIDEVLTDLKKQQTDIANNISTSQNEKERLGKLVGIKKNFNIISDEITGYKKQIEQVEERENKFNQNQKVKLHQHLQLLPFLESVREHIDAKKRIAEIDQNITFQKSTLNEKQAELEKVILSINRFLPVPTNSTSVEEDINQFRARVGELISKKERDEAEYNSQNKRVTATINKPEFKSFHFTPEKADQFLIHINNQLKVIGNDLNSFVENGISAENHLQVKAKAEETKTALAELKGQISQYTSLNQQITDAKTEMKSAEEKMPAVDLNTLQMEIEKIEEFVQQLHQDLLKRTLETAANVKELRQQLKDNDPCPVCGALHHPYAEEYLNILAEVQDRYDESNALLLKKRKEQSDYEKTIATLSESIDVNKKNHNNASVQLTLLLEKINHIKVKAGIQEVKTVDVVEEKLSENDKIIKRIEGFEVLIQLQSNFWVLNQEATQLQTCEANFNIAAQAVREVYNGTDINKDCDRFINQLNTINKGITVIKKLLEQLLQEKNEKASIESSTKEILNEPLKQLGYNSIENAHQHILSNVEADKLRNEETAINSEKQKLNGLIQAAQKRLQIEIQSDDETLNLEECENGLQTLVEKIEELQQSKSEVDAKILTDSQRRKNILGLESEITSIQQQNYKWELLKNYIGDSEGKKFGTFAQTLTLKKLVALANKQLVKLNDRYLLDMPKEDEDDDLTISDTFHGNERRSVKTLSGGEKFLVSLSLAVALSDLASRNLRIESLFIDEGFGTLDPEALDQAVSTLEQLQTESNKTIGIISHVDALKERIQTQIQMEKGNNGFSAVKLVPELN